MPTRNIDSDYSEAEYELRLARLREAVRVGEEAFTRGEFVEVDRDDLPDFLAALGQQATAKAQRLRG